MPWTALLSYSSQLRNDPPPHPPHSPPIFLPHNVLPHTHTHTPSVYGSAVGRLLRQFVRGSVCACVSVICGINASKRHADEEEHLEASPHREENHAPKARLLPKTTGRGDAAADTAQRLRPLGSPSAHGAPSYLTPDQTAFTTLRTEEALTGENPNGPDPGLLTTKPLATCCCGARDRSVRLGLAKLHGTKE